MNLRDRPPPRGGRILRTVLAFAALGTIWVYPDEAGHIALMMTAIMGMGR